MNWELMLQVTAPLTLMMAWGYNRLQDEIKEARNDLKGIDQRLSRLEGRFEERGYWESRKNGTEK